MTVVDSISNTAFGYAGIVNDGTTSLLMKGGSSKTDGLLTIPSGVIPASGDYSIELIFKHFGYFSPATTRLSMLLQMDSDNQIDLYIDATRFSPVNNVAGSYAGTIDSLNYSTGVAPNGKYHFVLVANSSNNTLALYVNGVQLPTIYSGSIGRQSGAGWLGAFGAPRSSYSFPFMGAFQKIAIYGSALSPSAIAAHFAATGF